MYLPPLPPLFLACLLPLLPTTTATAAATDHHPWHPVITTDFPDPSLLQVDNGTWVQIATSPDFQTWTLLTGQDALAGQLAAWIDDSSATSSAVWAPAVFKRERDGVFVLYYSATKAGTGGRFHCIGVATSPSITGPYTPTSPSPWLCPLDQGGAIDPAYFLDPASKNEYIVYKIDGNSISATTPIELQQISADGFSKVGEAVQLLTNDAGENLVEAPGLFRMGDRRFVLAYSTGSYADASYALRFAVARGLLGPYEKQGEKAWLGTGDYGLTGPGSAGFADQGRKIAFHGYADQGCVGRQRAMFVGVADGS